MRLLKMITTQKPGSFSSHVMTALGKPGLGGAAVGRSFSTSRKQLHSRVIAAAMAWLKMVLQSRVNAAMAWLKMVLHSRVNAAMAKLLEWLKIILCGIAKWIWGITVATGTNFNKIVSAAAATSLAGMISILVGFVLDLLISNDPSKYDNLLSRFMIKAKQLVKFIGTYNAVKQLFIDVATLKHDVEILKIEVKKNVSVPS